MEDYYPRIPEGNNAFISLLTGLGKWLCYVVLPYAFDELFHDDGSITCSCRSMLSFTGG